ncbi:MAG: hypothetical protein QF437_03600 [Planctomycetota bacterium]|jgi:hypothetical protein|nr:hypothetical protein [Planctomycetota bacterium]MDP7129544.1 hypothetical protein [Planctomycetota bacterium]MDP7252680.1 hypothetical protein [Planctomycetota bacterium]
MKRLLCSLSLLAFALPVSADRIVFVDGMELEGTVLKQGEIDLTVRVEYGKIRLRKDRVDRIELDVETRLSEIDASDTQRYLELAKLCEHYGDPAGVMSCLANAAENEDMPPDKLLQLSELYEKKKMKKELAITLYRYLELNPGRQDLRAKLEVLEGEFQKADEEKRRLEEEEAKRLAAEEEKKLKEQEAKAKIEAEERRKALLAYAKERTIEGAPADDPAGKGETPKTETAPSEKPDEGTKAKTEAAPTDDPATETTVAKAEVKPETEIAKTETEVVKVEEPVAAEKKEEEEGKDGLEANERWKSQDWANPAEYEVVDQGGEEKNLLARISFTKTDKDKAAIGLDYPANLSDKGFITFDTFNGCDRPISIAIAVQTLPGYAWFESYATTIRPNKWAVGKKIQLDTSKFKSADANWQYKSPIKNLNNTIKIYFLIYHRAPQGNIFLDNIRFVAKEEPKEE